MAVNHILHFLCSSQCFYLHGGVNNLVITNQKEQFSGPNREPWFEERATWVRPAKGLAWSSWPWLCALLSCLSNVKVAVPMQSQQTVYAWSVLHIRWFTVKKIMKLEVTEQRLGFLLHQSTLTRTRMQLVMVSTCKHIFLSTFLSFRADVSFTARNHKSLFVYLTNHGMTHAFLCLINTVKGV